MVVWSMGQKNQDCIVLWRYGAKESGLDSAVEVWDEKNRMYSAAR